MMTEIESNNDPKETILKMIRQSDDKGLKGRFYKSSDYLNTISFSDVMDIVMLYISMQPDTDRITRIKTSDFYRLTEDIHRKWAKTQKQESLSRLQYAWLSEPGPMDGYMGPAESYFSIYPGPLREDYLRRFFDFPRDLPVLFLAWPAYRQYHIENMVFPKWRRKNNMKKIGAVFELSEMICTEMRKGAVL